MRWIHFQCNLHCPTAASSCGAHARSRVRVRVRVFNEMGFHAHCPNGRFSSWSKLRFMVDIPFVDNDPLAFTACLHRLSPTYRNKRSITTWVGSVEKREVTKALENLLSTIEDPTLSKKDMCSVFIERLIRSGNLSDVVYAFSCLHGKQIHLGLSTYNILLNAASETNNFNLFAEIFKRLLFSELPPDFTSYVHVAKAFRNVADSDSIKFHREISEITIQRVPIIMNRIIFVAAKSGQLDKSLMIFEELKNSKANVDTVTFNTVLVMLGRAGKVDQMLYEFNAMKDFDLDPDIITYNTLINCLRRLGRLDMCKSFAKEMVERGIKLDLRTYTALIDGFGRAGHFEDAMKLFDEMKKLQRPSIYVYRAMISNLKKFGRFEMALILMEEMNCSTSKLIGPEDFKRKKKRNYNRKV